MYSAKLIFADGTVLQGRGFGSHRSASGEAVFNTGMVGYPECFTDPSYYGQILILTYPIIGNYGVPGLGSTFDLMKSPFESDRVHIAGLVVSEISENYSHWNSVGSLHDWLTLQGVPGISGIDTRFLTQKLREQGATLAKIVIGKPIFGICLGHQLLARAAGASTYKLKFGHRSQNQPCIQVGTKRCYITSQNHGYAVAEESLPQNWEPWFFNANDGTNEGLRHRSKPFFSVQFHPEASPGPLDTSFLFDDFVKLL